MYDAAFLSDPVRLQPDPAARLQRAEGSLDVSVRVRGQATVLDRLRQVGCLKARFPRRADPAWLELVSLNTSGGIAAGDRLDLRVGVGAGARAAIAGQAAERFYRASPGSPPARMRTIIDVAPGASAEWLPQETILFDGCALDRRLEIEMAADASFLGLEWLVFGRAAMGESIERAAIRDLIRIRRDGRLILHDALRLDGSVASWLQHAAIAAGARAAATLVLVAPDAEEGLARVRAALDGSDAGASASNGMLFVRALAADARTLRAQVAKVLDVLCFGRRLPRVWQC